MLGSWGHCTHQWSSQPNVTLGGETSWKRYVTGAVHLDCISLPGSSLPSLLSSSCEVSSFSLLCCSTIILMPCTSLLWSRSPKTHDQIKLVNCIKWYVAPVKGKLTSTATSSVFSSFLITFTSLSMLLHEMEIHQIFLLYRANKP